MSDLKVPGFKASEILAELSTTFGSLTDAERAAQIKKTAAIFELRIKNESGKEAVWTIDLKDKGSIYGGPVQAPAKAGVTLIMSDATFEQLASGKACPFSSGFERLRPDTHTFEQLDGQKAFMTGKLKSKGNIMLATKLTGVLGTAKAKAKL